MNILLTGGSGDLGLVLAPQLAARGEQPVVLDLRPPRGETAVYRPGSILDRRQLAAALSDIDLIVHIAAWHGIHQVRGEKDVWDFWDLNVTGTFNVLECAVQAGIKRVVFISSSSVAEWPDIYGSSKVLAEQVVRSYIDRHRMRIVTLRPRAFIPHWNRETYADFIGWAQWFWKGAVHIDDVAAAVLQSIDLLNREPFNTPPPLLIDGAYQFTPADLATWDAAGPGSSFAAVYPQYVALAGRYDLDTTVKPQPLDNGPAQEWLGYQPTYSLLNLLQELERYGASGPQPPHF